MELFKKMVETLSVTGNEENLADLIEKEVKPFADEIRRDVLGNLIVLKKGTGSNPKKMMLSAHMDEIGFMVTFIDEKGFVHFSAMGGLFMMSIARTPVIFKNGTRGIMVFEGKHKTSELNMSHFHIDIGAETKTEAETMVSVGDVGGFTGTLCEIGKNRYSAKSMDDKIACYIQIEALKKLKKTIYDTYFVFSVQEEVGLRGATTAAYAIEPDYGIALDVTGVADELNSAAPNDVYLGKGAAIKVTDNSIVCSRQMVNFLVETAKAEKIPYQMEVLPYGGTDAGAIHMTKGGVVTGGISIPTRYIHSTVETVDKRDVAACIDLVVALLGKEIK